MSKFVETLEIKQVSQEKEDEEAINIDFTIEQVAYQLFLVKNKENKFEPKTIFHLDNLREMGKICPVCKGKGSFCVKLEKNKEQLFQHLIQYPTIRLEWIYLDYDQKDHA